MVIFCDRMIVVVRFEVPPRRGRWLTFPNPYALVDDSAAPIYYSVARSPDQVDDETYAAELEWAIQWWKHVDHPVGWVADMREYSDGTASRRHQYAEFLQAINPYQREFLVASSVITANAKQQGVITAISWMTATMSRSHTSGSLEDSVNFLRKELEDNGIDPGPYRIPDRPVMPEQNAGSY